MKVFYLSFLFLTGFCISNARADFAGAYSGVGDANDSVGGKMACTEIQVDLTQTASVFSRKGGKFSCGVLSSMLVPFDAEIKGTELYVNGSKVGELTETSVTAKLPQGPLTSEFSARRIDAKTIAYEEKLNVGFGFMTVRGNLTVK